MLIVGALAVVLILVVSCCSALNVLTRRRILNGWLWGGAVVVLLVFYHLVSVYTADRDTAAEMSPELTGEVFGTTIGVSLLLALAGWRALAWRRAQTIEPRR